MARSFSTVCVIGIGGVGSALVALLARAGHDVLGIEARGAELAAGRERIKTALATFGLSEADLKTVADRIHCTIDFDLVSRADLVIEAVSEQSAVKIALLRQADAVCAPETVFATTSSGFPVTEIASASGRMTRTVGLHLSLPASGPAHRDIEVVTTPVTDAAVSRDVTGFVEGLGCRPVPTADVPGFIGGGLLLRYLNDAAKMFEQRYASRDAIDTAMTLGCGLPIGPLAQLDLMGLDVVTDSLAALAERSPDGGYKPAPVLTRMVEAGLLGRKSGRGFYDYAPTEDTGAEEQRTTPEARVLSRIGIVGSGTMAAGIAEVCARAGYDTVLVGRSEQRVKEALSTVERSLDRRVRRGKLTAGDMAATLENLSGTVDLQSLGDRELVLEAVAEDIDVKRAVFAAIDNASAPDAILATTTSSLSVIKCATATSRPERVIGLHFFNPAPAMKLVEVVSTFLTAAPVVKAADALVSALGKHAVHCTDRTGFIVNMLLFPYLNHAVRMVQDHHVSPDRIDAVMTGCHGYPVGPFKLLDIVGLDVALSIQQRLYEHSPEPLFEPAGHLVSLVDSGLIGVKTGQGFRLHPK